MEEQYELNWDSPRSIRAAFKRFHEAHPEVKARLVIQCYEAKHHGFKHYGIGCLWEVMRWHFQVKQRLGEDFKLNNNLRAHYARMIMKEHPDLKDFFELRRL